MTKNKEIIWKSFFVGDLFDIHPTKSYKLKNNVLFANEGSTPVVVNSSYNNGIGGYVPYKPTEKGNIITFSDTTSAMAIFYQPSDFIGYSHIQGMYPREQKWSKYALLFFLTIFKKKAYLLGFDYVNKFTREMAKNIKVDLPTKLNGELDFAYMENYMHNIKLETYNSIKKLKKIDSKVNEILDTKLWKEFKVGDLFELVNCKAYHKKDIEENKNGIAYITRSKFNNGLKCRVNLTSNMLINPANTISFGAENANFFYQPEKYITGNKMYYIDTRELSYNSCLFIKTVLEKTFTDNYSFSKGMIPDRIREKYIKLPIDEKGNPDYKFMDEYIESINKNKNLIGNI